MKIKKRNFEKRNLIKEYIISVCKKNLPKISNRAINEKIVREKKKKNTNLTEIFYKICVDTRLYRENSVPKINEYIGYVQRKTDEIKKIKFLFPITKREIRYFKNVFLRNLVNK